VVVVVVVTLKVPVVDPAGIETDTGTNAGVPFVHSSTETPPASAGAARVTVPVGDVPPLTLVGLTETEERTTCPSGFILNVAVLLTPL
jgi:hypothetical protein